ncbi:hypothetical protein BC831DRAFT_456265 [Entophlyctis helioformis]|nr:hypothetical protein BC831DRAFT_456265 [Entophlyctis helioformis]
MTRFIVAAFVALFAASALAAPAPAPNNDSPACTLGFQECSDDNLGFNTCTQNADLVFEWTYRDCGAGTYCNQAADSTYVFCGADPDLAE